MTRDLDEGKRESVGLLSSADKDVSAAVSSQAWEALAGMRTATQNGPEAVRKSAEAMRSSILELSDPFAAAVNPAVSAKGERPVVRPAAAPVRDEAARDDAPEAKHNPGDKEMLERLQVAIEVPKRERQVKPATHDVRYGATDDKSTRYEIETKYFANRRESVMTDPNGRKIIMETGEPDAAEKRPYFKDRTDVKSAEILDKNGKTLLEIKDGKCTYQTQDGKTETKDVESVKFNPKPGVMEITFKDGTSSAYRGDGSLTTYDALKRPTYMRTGSGAEIQYHYDGDATGNPKLPARITIDKAGVEFTYDKNTGLYRSTKDGAPVESAVSVGIGGGANTGVSSVGVGLCVPVDKRQRITVDHNGALTISSAERPGEDTRVHRTLATDGTMTEVTNRTLMPSTRGLLDLYWDMFGGNDYPTRTTARRFGKDGTDLSLRTKPK